MVENQKIERDFKFFMNVLMESDIIVDNPKRDYIHMLDIEKDFQSGEYFKTIMHLSCLIESNIYQLLLKKLPSPPQSFKAREVKKMQELPLGLLINWIAGEPFPKKRFPLVCYPDDWQTPLINENEKLVLQNLREIRNDMAHIPYLTYNVNLKKEVVRKVIDEVMPIHNKLVEEIIKNQIPPTESF